MSTTTTRSVPEAAAATGARGDGVTPLSPARVWLRVTRHHLRILRTPAIAWTVALAGMSAGVVATFDERYGSEAELQVIAEMEGIPAFEAMLGRFVQPATVEGLTLSRWGIFAIFVAVWGMLSACRLLRRAEDTGHVEPLRAGVISPRALLGAALAAILTTHLLFAVAIGVSHSAAGMDPATSWALGAAMALLAACFAALGALASQLATSYRRAVGLVGSVLGVLLGLRILAAASTTPEWVWWTTPFGWVGYLHPDDAARGAVFSALTVLLLALLTGAWLLARRDLNAGWIGGVADEPRRTPRPVRGHRSLAVRLAAGHTRTWGAIVTLVVLVFGLLARDFSEAIADLEAMITFAANVGWVGLDTAEGVVAFTFTIVALLLSLFAAGQAVAIREEEASWRIEHLLVRPLARVRWLVTRLAVAAGALVALALVAGVAAWIGTAVGGAPIALQDALAAALNVVPVAWLALGVGVGVVGLLPRLTAALTYGIVLAAYLLDFVGGMLQLPEAVLDASPFRQLAAVPAEDVAGGAALVMLTVGTAAAAVGVWAFRRRDLREA